MLTYQERPASLSIIFYSKALKLETFCFCWLQTNLLVNTMYKLEMSTSKVFLLII